MKKARTCDLCGRASGVGLQKSLMTFEVRDKIRRGNDQTRVKGKRA